mmetsp:Transcript_64385/g.188377  ORF Transcript_64385/g.188377 Transcript_64385/m.188377 type:complete len:323 (+) Transcript_64385:417-1385(+)
MRELRSGANRFTVPTTSSSALPRQCPRRRLRRRLVGCMLRSSDSVRSSAISSTASSTSAEASSTNEAHFSSKAFILSWLQASFDGFLSAAAPASFAAPFEASFLAFASSSFCSLARFLRSFSAWAFSSSCWRFLSSSSRAFASRSSSFLCFSSTALRWPGGTYADLPPPAAGFLSASRLLPTLRSSSRGLLEESSSFLLSSSLRGFSCFFSSSSNLFLIDGDTHFPPASADLDAGVLSVRAPVAGPALDLPSSESSSSSPLASTSSAVGFALRLLVSDGPLLPVPAEAFFGPTVSQSPSASSFSAVSAESPGAFFFFHGGVL